MNEIIQIKCPFCSSILSVKNQQGIESKNVTCPICKHKYPFTEFKPVVASNNADPDTEYPDHKEERTELDKTQIAQPNYTLGKLKLHGTTRSYQLQPGRNVIGRKATKSEATIQIDTAENRMMSREHIVIEVKKVPAKGFVHYLSLYKEKVNKTFIGSEPLLYGDSIVLNHGDIIKLPDATLKFEIPDDEGTDF